jgi:hypothetical protein
MFEKAEALCVETSKMLAALIQSLKSQEPEASSQELIL